MKIWIGRTLTALVVLALLADAGVALLMPEKLAHDMTTAGFQLPQTATIGIIVLACAVLYAIPATSFLGAILATGFLGGAICTHFRMGEAISPPTVTCVVLGVLLWAGLYLRSAQIRDLVWARSRA